MSNKNYQLERLEIELKTWGEFAGKHVGKIKFSDGGNNAFMFELTPEQTLRYIEVIKEDLIRSAGSLGVQLAESLKALPSSEPVNPLLETA